MRPVFYFECLTSVLAALVFFALQPVIGVYAAVPPAVLYAVMIGNKMYRYLRREEPRIELPMLSAIAATAISTFNLGFLPILFLTILYLEDPFQIMEAETIRLRQTVRIAFEPFRRKSSLAVLLATAVPGAIVWRVTGTPLSMLPSAAAYAMILYSYVRILPAEAPRPGVGLLEKMAGAIPVVRSLLIRFYRGDRVADLMRKAGVLGAEFDILLTKLSGAASALIVAGLVLSPVAALMPWTLGIYLFGGLAGSTAALLLAPLAYLKARASARAGRLSSNLVMSLSYILTGVSVGLDIAQSFSLLRTKQSLARMFGLDREVKVFEAVKATARGDVVEEYGKTVPEKRFRDAVLGVHTSINILGFAAARKRLWELLNMVLTDLVRKTEARFSVMGGAMEAIIMVLAIIPIFAGPQAAPAVIASGLVIMMVMSMAAMMSYPPLPSEYPLARRRLRGAAVVLTTVSAAASLALYALYPGYPEWCVVLGALIGGVAAADYATRPDRVLDQMFFDHGGDLLREFAVGIERTNSVVQALRDMAVNPAYPERLRERLREMATRAEVVGDILVTRGGYWEKYFSFISWISQRFGRIPVELTEFMSSLITRLSDIIAAIRTHAVELALLGIMVLGIVDIEIAMLAGMHSGQMVQAGAMQRFSGSLSGIASILISGSAAGVLGPAMEAAALMLGVGLSKARTNTFFSTKHVLLPVIVQALMYILIVRYHLVRF